MRILFWFRKDLRLDDNTGLHEAARAAAHDVVPFYASEPEILGRADMAPIRVQFVLDSLTDLAAAVERAGSRLVLDHGEAAETVLRAARRANADAVYWNDEYEPALMKRDRRVQQALEKAGLAVRRFHDRLLVPPGAVQTGAGTPFVTFTPFARACEALPLGAPLPAVRRLAAHGLDSPPVAKLEQLGMKLAIDPWPGGAAAARKRLRRFVDAGLEGYATLRDRPDLPNTSRLSADLKFGTISPRAIVAAALEAAREDRRLAQDASKFVSEVRWRDFYAHVLYHFPHCERGSFQKQFDAIEWLGDRRHLQSWTAGKTGYPIVDAGMRELVATGYMHNRVRMVVASFLTKDLLLDWRLGERHFMKHLIDGDLANNNGGWQWAASTGTDAQPYFRIFNPVLQGTRFDPEGAYVKRWVPELAGLPARWIHRPWEAPATALDESGMRFGTDYPRPIVDHHEQRDRALAMYEAAKS